MTLRFAGEDINTPPERRKALDVVREMIIARAKSGDAYSTLMERYNNHLHDDVRVEDIINHFLDLQEKSTDELLLLLEVGNKIAQA